MAILALAAALVAASCSRGDRPPGSAQRAGAAAAVRGLAQIAAADSEFDRERWDPDAVVKSVGPDANRLYRWVQLNTHWVPYRGILRGPAGVLNDRLGNGIDRALLLATLLERAGYRVRLAHSALPLAEVRAALPDAAGEQVARADGAAPFERDAETVRDVAGDAGPDADAVRLALDATSDSLARAAVELSRRTSDQSARVLRAVPRADSLRRRASWFRIAPVALQDHWWVQRQDGAAWVDMDLLAAAGARLAPAAAPVETLELAALNAAPLYQEIDVRVVGEYRSGRTLREKRLLDHTLRPADVLGQPIVLQFWPARWFGDSVARAELSRNAGRNLPAEHDFGAMLVVGRGTVAAAGFGDVGETAADKAAAEAGPMGGLAGAFSQSMEDKPERPADLTAVWIEYEFRVPGEAARTARREVFDLIGPAARASGAIPAAALDSMQRRTRAFALAMRTELLPVSCRLSSAFVNQLAASALRGNARLFAAASGSAAPSAAALARLSEQSAPLPSPLLTLAVARLSWSPWARDIYIGRAGLLTRHVYAASGGGRTRLIDAVDIVANDVEVGPVVRDPFAVRVGQGVFDTNAEALLWTGPGVGNAGDAFAAGTAWTAIAPENAASVGELPLPSDVKQRIRSDAVSGRVVLAPAAEVRVGGEPFAGWWRVDPVTGTTLGMGANGWGLQGAEYSARTRESLTRAQYFNELARIAGPNFVKAFGTQMVICMAMTAGADASSGRFATLSVKDEASRGVHECTGDAIVIAGLATVPLLAITMNEMAAIRAARLARLAAAAGEAGKVIGGSNPGGTKPNLGGDGPPKPPQEPQKTRPYPENPPPDPGKPQMDPNKTHDMGKTQPDLGTTRRQEPESVDPAKTKQQQPDQPDPAATKPQQGSPEGEPPQSQPKGDQPPGEPKALDPSKLSPAQQDLLASERELVALKQQKVELETESLKATSDWIRYELNDPADPRYDPKLVSPDAPPYDPAVAQQLRQAMDQAASKSIEAVKPLEDQFSTVNSQRHKLGALRLKWEGIPSSPPPGFIGCPTSCSGLAGY